MVHSSAIKLHLASRGHYEQVAEVAIPADPAHAKEAEALNCCMFIRLAGRLVSPSDRVRSGLYHAKRCCRPGEGLPSAKFCVGAGSDQRIDETPCLLIRRRQLARNHLDLKPHRGE
jgi:hypothetical protein